MPDLITTDFENDERQALSTIEALRGMLTHASRTARADSDIEIVQLYLREMAAGKSPCSVNTIRNYRMVLMRFFAYWKAFHCGKPLAEFAREDVIDFLDFLRAPDPEWIGPKRTKDPAKKAYFTKPLSEAEVTRNERIIRKFFDYAKSQGRVLRNPFKEEVPTGRPPRKAERQTRLIDPTMWAAIWEAQQQIEDDASSSRRRKPEMHALRSRWVLTALYIPALRIDELAQSTASQIWSRTDPQGTIRYYLQIPEEIAKGNKEADVPITERFITELQAYRSALGIFNRLPNANDTWPLVMNLRGTRSLTKRQIYNIAVEVFRTAADILESRGDTDRARKLRATSPHWIRHSRANHLLSSDTDVRSILAIMRHDHLSTLDQYLHAEDDATHESARLSSDEMMLNR